MTISKIEVTEFQCILCGYKWINRVNGKDGPIPERCAKCKRFGWDGEKSDPITPQEAGIRTRIKHLAKLYYLQRYWLCEYHREKPPLEDYWDIISTAKFLTLEPRPTMAELKHVLFPPGLVIGLNSQNQHRVRGWVPNPEKPGWMKYDMKEYIKLMEFDAQKHQEAMKQIVNDRELQQYHKPKKLTLQQPKHFDLISDRGKPILCHKRGALIVFSKDRNNLHNLRLCFLFIITDHNDKFHNDSTSH